MSEIINEEPKVLKYYLRYDGPTKKIIGWHQSYDDSKVQKPYLLLTKEQHTEFFNNSKHPNHVDIVTSTFFYHDDSTDEELLVKYRKTLADLVDSKQVDAETFVAEREVTGPKKERLYKKIYHAKVVLGKVEAFVTEKADTYGITVEELVAHSTQLLTNNAMIRNLSVEDYAQTIIASEYKWSMALETFYQAIESYETLGGLILLDGRIDLIKPFLEEGALLGKYEDLTPAEVFGKTMEELTTIITEYKGLLGK